MEALCGLCPHKCRLQEGQTGFCRARKAQGGEVVPANYGLLTALQLDPIEKKPLAMFHPGSTILSAGSFGCNLRCPFCQNHEISQAGRGDVPERFVSPEDLVRLALDLRPRGNIGVAFTYNEPLVGYEYVMDTSLLLRENGLKSVAVTNGMINPAPMEALAPRLDAMNIDLKSFSQDFYSKCQGSLETVKSSIKTAVRANVHVEVTFLVVPGMNDSPQEMEALSAWLAGVDPDIVLHITRFFPAYRMAQVPPTGIELMRRLRAIARGRLSHVFLGNV